MTTHLLCQQNTKIADLYQGICGSTKDGRRRLLDEVDCPDCLREVDHARVLVHKRDRPYAYVHLETRGTHEAPAPYLGLHVNTACDFRGLKTISFDLERVDCPDCLKVVEEARRWAPNVVHLSGRWESSACPPPASHACGQSGINANGLEYVNCVKCLDLVASARKEAELRQIVGEWRSPHDECPNQREPCPYHDGQVGGSSCTCVPKICAMPKGMKFGHSWNCKNPVASPGDHVCAFHRKMIRDELEHPEQSVATNQNYIAPTLSRDRKDPVQDPNGDDVAE